MQFPTKKSGREPTSVRERLPAGYRRIQQRCQKGLFFRKHNNRAVKTQVVWHPLTSSPEPFRKEIGGERDRSAARKVSHRQRNAICPRSADYDAEPVCRPSGIIVLRNVAQIYCAERGRVIRTFVDGERGFLVSIEPNERIAGLVMDRQPVVGLVLLVLAFRRRIVELKTEI